MATTAHDIMSFHTGDRVEITNPKTGEVILGTVTSINFQNNRVKVVNDDHTITYTASPRIIQKSTKPAPRVVPNPFVKGDRVEWDTPNGVNHGTVTNTRNSRVTTDIDEKPGYVRRMEHTSCRMSKVPAPAPKEPAVPRLVRTDVPNPLDAYSVTKYRIINIGHEGGAIKATIAKNGNLVIYAENGGYGGPTEFYSIQGDQKVVDEFMKAQLDTWIQFGGTKESFTGDDTADVWAEWCWNQRQKDTGKLWEDEVKEMHAVHLKCEEHHKKEGWV